MVCFTARFSTRQINPFQFSPACTSTSLNKQNLCVVSCTFFTSTPNHIVIASHSTCFIRNIVGFWNCSHNMKLTLLCRSSEAWSSFAFAPKMPWKAHTVQCCSIHPDPIRSLKSSPTDWDISVLLSNLCWTGSGLKRIQHDNGSPRNVAFANARWWHQAEYTSTITLNGILQRHNCSCKNCHGIVHPAVQHVHDTHYLITLQLTCTMWEFCTCSLVLCGQRPTAPRPWSKLFRFFWNRVCCSYSRL